LRTRTRSRFQLKDAGFLGAMRIGQTMRWATTNSVSITRKSFAFFLCRANGKEWTLEGCDAHKWLMNIGLN
jgi:hypothetical protein